VSTYNGFEHDLARICEIAHQHGALVYADITTPVAAGQFALDHAGIGPDSRTSKAYPAGHSVFEDEQQLARLADDMRTWVTTLGK
jgi:kynureninase